MTPTQKMSTKVKLKEEMSNIVEGSGRQNDVANPRSAPNLDRLKEPRKEKERPKAKFEHYKDDAIRDQIEIQFNTKNGRNFTGSVTSLEVKHGI